MKNIKVNIRNLEGKQSSTTINFVICEKYYEIFGDYGSEYGLIHQTVEEYRKNISDFAQLYTNRLVQKAVDVGYKGVDQYYIESNMINQFSVVVL